MAKRRWVIAIVAVTIEVVAFIVWKVMRGRAEPQPQA